MNVIRCNYNILTKTPCGPNNYSCRKIRLPFITACGNCDGNNCTKVSNFEVMDDAEDECLEKNAFELFDI